MDDKILVKFINHLDKGRVMEQMSTLLNEIKDWIWGAPLLLLLLGTGAYLTFILKGVQFRYLGYAFKQVVAKKQEESKGDISHFEALMTSLARCHWNRNNRRCGNSHYRGWIGGHFLDVGDCIYQYGNQICRITFGGEIS